VENSHDDNGIVWPRAVAPAQVHVIAAHGRDDVIFAAAQKIAAGLDEAGIEVILDDRRRISPGVKFADSELIGIPMILVVGKGLADGVVEIRDRATGERREVAVEDAVSTVTSIVRS
jgi:prolyl-tRNA synthetase